MKKRPYSFLFCRDAQKFQILYQVTVAQDLPKNLFTAMPGQVIYLAVTPGVR